MERYVKLGIIGCGWFTENAHMPALIKESRIRVTALFDSDSARAKERAVSITNGTAAI